MIIAVSSTGKELECKVDPRFGRAKYFIIYDTDTDNFEAINNDQNLQAAQGAGIQAAQLIVKQNATLAISGNLGPKAFTTLKAAKIKSAHWSDGSVKDAIQMAKNGELKFAKTANVKSHWM